MVTSETKHDTGLRILEILKLMLKNDISKHQMIDFLKDNREVGSVYTQEAFILKKKKIIIRLKTGFFQ